MSDNLPSKIKSKLDLNSLSPLKTAFIDRHLKETFCDIAFDCKFKDQSKGKIKLIVLIEHQSTPDRQMPFRVMHYLNSLLYNELNSRRKNKQKKLPPAYALVFYHGKQKHYPYSLNLRDGFENPDNIMASYFNQEVNLINIHKHDDDKLLQQKLHGIMAYALKHSRDADLLDIILNVIHVISTIDYQSKDELQFTQRILEYLIGFNSVQQPEKLVKHVNKLPTPIRGEVMTIAEQLAEIMFKDKIEQRVRDELEPQVRDKYENLARQREEQSLIQTAIKALKKGADVSFVADITSLSTEQVQTIKAQHNL